MASPAITRYSSRMTRHARTAVCVLAASIAVATAAAADPFQAALVESLTGKLPRVELMDYVRTGQVIRLGPQQTIVLTYVSSCVRETITGGTVMVGTDQSEAQGAEVTRTSAQCGSAAVVLTGGSVQVGGRMFRGRH
jgi:hypothetical protein